MRFLPSRSALAEFGLEFKVWRHHLSTKISKWLSAHKADIALALAWGLITWSAFLWSPRAWAASVGLYLLVEALTPVIAELMSARREALRARKDR